MGLRLDLHTLLLTLVDNVYHQAPTNLTMVYPCIIYTLDNENVNHADNSVYHRKKRYQVMIIDENPDSDIPDSVGDLPLSSFERWYAADQLNHYIYQLYF